MKTRMALLALAATATLATSALTPTQASAWGFHGGFRAGCCWRGGFHPGFFHPGLRFGWGFRHAYWGIYHPWPRVYPRWGWYPRWHWYPRPVVYGAVGAAAVAAATVPVAAPAAAPAPQPNCLTKQYLPNGAVEFADVCTQEQAIGTPNGAQPPAQPGAQ
jgi:hypothetical protein